MIVILLTESFPNVKPESFFFFLHLLVSISIPGFHLSGTVTEPASPLFSQPERVNQVSISFDR